MPRYQKCTLSGTLAGGVEAWSVSLNYAAPPQVPPPSAGDIQRWSADVAAALGTLVTSQLSNLLSLQGKITKVSTYHYEAIGAPALYSGVSSANFTGGATPNMPLQTSMVCSLRTGVAGRRNRGRIYWPAQGAGVMTGGRFSNSDAQGAPEDFKLLIEGIADAWTGESLIGPVVVSAAGDFVTPVTSIQVGDVPDTQRRRRDALVEVYYTESIAQPG